MTTNRAARNALLVTSAALMLLTLYLVFIWVPTEKNLGISQRIFYFHVAQAWVGFFAFFWVVVGSVGYLWKRSRACDRLAYASAEIGMMFTTMMLVTGVIWAKPAWGVWWTWDPKLTTSLILWLIYAAYLMLRAYSPPGDQGSRFAAILGIVGFRGRPHHLPVRGVVAHRTSAGRNWTCCRRRAGAVHADGADGRHHRVHLPVCLPANGAAVAAQE